MKKKQKKSISDLSSYALAKKDLRQLKGGLCPGDTEGATPEQGNM